jgi:RNA polymerase sigma-70 factor (TIGR02943 family)
MKISQTDHGKKEEQLKNWVGRFGDDLYAWAYYRTSEGSVSEDLVQETFMAAWQGFDRFKGKSEVRTWLFGILNNKIKDHFRNRLRSPLTKIEQELISDSVEGFFDHGGSWKQEHRPQNWDHTEALPLLDDQEFNNILHQCLKKLPAKWYSAVSLKYLDDKSGKDICQDLGITPVNFWQILHRAKLQLRECLEIHWFNR